MKYKGLYLNLITLLIRGPMNRAYGKELTTNALKKARKIYRNMLNVTEDIGSNNPMANNIYMGFVFMAIWKAADGKIKADDFNKVTVEFMHHPIVKRFMGGNDVNKAADMKKMETGFRRMAQWADEHPEYKEKTWDFNFDETKHSDGTYYYFTRCPIEKFARENGYLDILPVVCDIDYLIAEARHSVLRRQHTLATGGKICDYWFVGDKVKEPK